MKGRSHSEAAWPLMCVKCNATGNEQKLHNVHKTCELVCPNLCLPLFQSH